VDWIKLAQDRDQWWALVNTVMNFGGIIRGGEFLDKLNDSQVSKRWFPTT
jgi:hypothetical protein